MNLEALPVTENLWSPEVIEQKRSDEVRRQEELAVIDAAAWRRSLEWQLKWERDHPKHWTERFIRKVLGKPYNPRWEERFAADWESRHVTP